MTDNVIQTFIQYGTVGIVGIFIGNYLAIGRDKRKEFNDATENTRNNIRDELQDSNNFFVNFTIIDDLSYIHRQSTGVISMDHGTYMIGKKMVLLV